MTKLLVPLLVGFVFFMCSTNAYAMQTYDLRGNTDYSNIIFQRTESNTNKISLTDAYSVSYADVTGDGVKDLIFGDWSDDVGGTDTGSVYIYDGATLKNTSGYGNVKDIKTDTSYLIRITGSAANEELGEGITTGDFDGDGKIDLAVGSWADKNGADSGAVYIILGSRLRTFSGSVSVSSSNNYDLRIDGAAASNTFSYTGMITDDYDADGMSDLVVSSGFRQSAFYYFKGSLLNTLIGAGKTTNVGIATSYTAKYYESLSQGRLGDNSFVSARIGSDSTPDLLFSFHRTDYNGTDSGSVYVIDGSKLSALSSTGNNVDITSSSVYTLRIDGPQASSFLGFRNFGAIDFDGNGKVDIFACGRDIDTPGFSNNGACYIVADSIYASSYASALAANTGTSLNLANSANYSAYIAGATNGDGFSFGLTNAGDFDGDAYNDFIAGNLTGGNGYLIYSNIIRSAMSGSKQIDTSVTANVAVKYTGTFTNPLLPSTQQISQYCVRTQCLFEDVNGDGKVDLLLSDPGNLSTGSMGRLYVIFNFPHTISVTASQNQTNATNLTITGSVSAPNSVTTIAGVQWSTSNNPLGTWNACTATDGAFDSRSEQYTCQATGLVEGTHATYIRSYDSNMSYTTQSNYGVISLTSDVSAPTLQWSSSNGTRRTFGLDSIEEAEGSSVLPNSWYTLQTLPTFHFTKASDTTTGISHYQVIVQGEKDSHFRLYLDSIPADKPGLGNDEWDKTREDSERYTYYGDDDTIKIRSKKESDRLPPGAYRVKIRVYDKTGNYTDSAQQILRVQTRQAIFSSVGINQGFPLTLTEIGEQKHLDFSSIHPQEQQEFTVSSTTPLFSGISHGGARIYVEIRKERYDQTAQLTRYDLIVRKDAIVTPDSRFSIPLSPEQALSGGSYRVKVMAINEQQDYVELPEFTLTITSPSIYPSSVSENPILGVIDAPSSSLTSLLSPTPSIQVPIISPTLSPTHKTCILFDKVCW